MVRQRVKTGLFMFAHLQIIQKQRRHHGVIWEFSVISSTKHGIELVWETKKKEHTEVYKINARQFTIISSFLFIFQQIKISMFKIYMDVSLRVFRFDVEWIIII